MLSGGSRRFCGREFTGADIALIQEVVASCAGISRKELASTVCELLEWKRAAGGLKARECRDLLEELESRGLLKLPVKRASGWCGPRRSRLPSADTPCGLSGRVEQFAPVVVERVESREQRAVFQELLSRYHYLGYAMPYGARLQYLAYVSRPRREVVGCVQFSSPAWRIKVRDQWIGWDDRSRGERLQHVVNNSRLLVVARIRNLASTLLSMVLRRLRLEWQAHYGVEPYLVETLVDRQRFHGTCYRAANWLELGETSGRGRMDRQRERLGAEVKSVWVYPLVKHARGRLREGR